MGCCVKSLFQGLFRVVYGCGMISTSRIVNMHSLISLWPGEMAWLIHTNSPCSHDGVQANHPHTLLHHSHTFTPLLDIRLLSSPSPSHDGFRLLLHVLEEVFAVSIYSARLDAHAMEGSLPTKPFQTSLMPMNHIAVARRFLSPNLPCSKPTCSSALPPSLRVILTSAV